MTCTCAFAQNLIILQQDKIPYWTTYQLIVGRIVDDIQDTSLAGGCLQKEIEPSAQLVSRKYLGWESDQVDRATLRAHLSLIQ